MATSEVRPTARTTRPTPRHARRLHVPSVPVREVRAWLESLPDPAQGGGAAVTSETWVGHAMPYTDCFLCSEQIVIGDRWDTQTVGEMVDGAVVFRQRKAHRECILRMVTGGIGHLIDHDFWCGVMGDPDGGRTYHQSALEVNAWCMTHPWPTVDDVAD